MGGGEVYWCGIVAAGGRRGGICLSMLHRGQFKESVVRNKALKQLRKIKKHVKIQSQKG